MHKRGHVIEGGMMIECTQSQGRVRLRARVLFMGQDICVLLDGGDRPHTGALCTISNEGTHSYCLPHHREDELAHYVAEKFQKEFCHTVTCLCGIHIAAITKEEIHTVFTLTEALVEKLIPKVQLFVLTEAQKG